MSKTNLDELKSFSFFAGFDESLVQKLSAVVREVEFPAGSVILNAGETNDRLYFLRAGAVDVLVDNERVSNLSKVGEVFGEMSAFSGTAVSATIQAQSAVKCFYILGSDIESVDINEKHKLQALLYRVYSSVLNERIIATNQKAKMYESTARELEKAKRDLEQVTDAQMSFLRQASTKSKNVLLLEPDKKQSVTIKSALGGTGVQLHIASSGAEAQEFYQNTKPDIIFCEEHSALEFLTWCKDQNFAGPLVLLQSLDFNFDLLQKLKFVQNVISRDCEDRAGTVKSLLTAMTKITYKDFFGPQKYLSWGSEIKEKTICKSSEREDFKQEILAYFKSLGMRSTLLDRVQVAAEEMMMNAIYDAPVGADGKSLYNHLPRSTPVDLKPNEFAKLRYGSDGNMLAISVEDPFGALNREIVIKYLHSCYGGAAGTLNEAKGGAGRGLHQILESCDFTIFNIKPNKKTEVIGLFDIGASIQKKDNRPQFQFFFEL